jgi:hypothetical protein
MNMVQNAAVLGAVMAMTGFAPFAEAKSPTFHFGLDAGWPTDDCIWVGQVNHCHGTPLTGSYRKDEDRPHAYNRLSCSEARTRIVKRGFSKVTTKDCQGKSFSFTALRKGQRYFVKINAYTGRLKAHAL